MSKKSDIFSFAASFLAVMSYVVKKQDVPFCFRDAGALNSHLQEGFSGDFVSLIKKCLETDYHKRPSSTELLRELYWDGMSKEMNVLPSSWTQAPYNSEGFGLVDITDQIEEECERSWKDICYDLMNYKMKEVFSEFTGQGIYKKKEDKPF